MASHDNTEELIDYEDEQDVIANGSTAASNGAAAAADGDEKEKKNFSGIHSTGFRYFLYYTSLNEPFSNCCLRDFLLKPELLRAISDLGFEHPSEGE